MNEKLEKNKIILVIILVGIGLFYWFQWRPAEIRKSCAEEYKAISIQNYYWDFYEQCLKQHGLEK